MEGVLAGVISNVFHPRAAEKTESSVLGELEAVQQALASVNSRFDSASDPDLVAACIYEMQALTSRYRFLLRQARGQALSRAAVASMQAIKTNTRARSV